VLEPKGGGFFLSVVLWGKARELYYLGIVEEELRIEI
jgi:hypothetical protein